MDCLLDVNIMGGQIPGSELTSFRDTFPLSSKESHYTCPGPTQHFEFSTAQFHKLWARWPSMSD